MTKGRTKDTTCAGCGEYIAKTEKDAIRYAGDHVLGWCGGPNYTRKGTVWHSACIEDFARKNQNSRIDSIIEMVEEMVEDGMIDRAAADERIAKYREELS